MEFAVHIPHKWCELQYQQKAKEQIEKWLHDFEKGTTKKALCICGPNGIGKSTFARLFYTHFSYTWIESSANESRQKTKLLEQLNTLIHTRSLLYYLQQQKVGVIIDELDSVQDLERNILTVLKKDILPHTKHNPIIMICTHPSTVSSLKSFLEFVHLKPLTKEYAVDYIQKIVGENIDSSVVDTLELSYKNIHEKIKYFGSLSAEEQSNHSKSDHFIIPSTKEEMMKYIVKEYKQLDEKQKEIIYLNDTKYFNQTIFENIYFSENIDILDDFLFSRKMEYAYHNTQQWMLQEYMTFIDISMFRYISPQKINVVPKIYSKISQYLYQMKTYKSIKKYTDVSYVEPELLSILLLGICFTEPNIRKSIPHPLKNGLRRIGIFKDYWKKKMRKW